MKNRERRRPFFQVRIARKEVLKMSIRLDFRIDDSTQEKLDLLVAKTGKNKTQIMKDLINNARASDFRMTEKSSKEVQREIELIATRKYLITLYKRAITELNQLARAMNIANKYRKKQEEKSNIHEIFSDAYASELEKKFDDLEKLLGALTNEVKRVANNDQQSN